MVIGVGNEGYLCSTEIKTGVEVVEFLSDSAFIGVIEHLAENIKDIYIFTVNKKSSPFFFMLSFDRRTVREKKRIDLNYRAIATKTTDWERSKNFKTVVQFMK